MFFFFNTNSCHDLTLQSHSKHTIVELLHILSTMNKSNHMMLRIQQLEHCRGKWKQVSKICIIVKWIKDQVQKTTSGDRWEYSKSTKQTVRSALISFEKCPKHTEMATLIWWPTEIFCISLAKPQQRLFEFLLTFCNFTKPDLVYMVCHMVTRDKPRCSLLYLAVSKHPLVNAAHHSETYGKVSVPFLNTLCQLMSCKRPTNNQFNRRNSL